MRNFRERSEERSEVMFVAVMGKQYDPINKTAASVEKWNDGVSIGVKFQAADDGGGI